VVEFGMEMEFGFSHRRFWIIHFCHRISMSF